MDFRIGPQSQCFGSLSSNHSPAQEMPLLDLCPTAIIRRYGPLATTSMDFACLPENYRQAEQPSHYELFSASSKDLPVNIWNAS